MHCPFQADRQACTKLAEEDLWKFVDLFHTAFAGIVGNRAVSAMLSNMEKLYLVFWLLTSGNPEWVHCDEIEGWAKREQPSMDACQKKLERVKSAQPPEGVIDIWVECNYLTE